MRLKKEDNHIRSTKIGDKNEYEVHYEIGNTKKVKIGIWHTDEGEFVPTINVREYYKDRSGAEKPGKRGIALTVKQWKLIADNVDHMDEDVNEMVRDHQ